MLTQEQILNYLYNDDWFRQSNSKNKIRIKNEKGEQIEVPKSYYHIIRGSAKIVIRVSEHGTYLNTWIKSTNKPDKSLQNLSIVFSNKPISYKRETEPNYKIDKDGNEVEYYTYFVVEQYQYRLDTLSYKDFIKVINQLKRLEDDGVFSDPLRNKPSKKAYRNIVTPTDKFDKDIPSTNNPIHTCQTIVDKHRDKEIDKNGNIIESKVKQLVMEELSKPEVVALINDKLSSYIRKSEIEKKIKDIIKDVIEDFFKMMYNKRGFWKNNL